METIASLIQRFTVTKGDVAAVGVGTASPFLMGALGGAHPSDVQTVVNTAIAAGVSTLLTLGVKGGAAFVGAWLRADRKKKLTDNDPKNDNTAEGEGALADTIDPEHKEKQ
jgi:hypothetical protein